MMCSNCAVGGDCVEVVTKAVFRLWDISGGTVNAKGYKVIFKDPKEGGFKKSQKGMCRVYRDERGALAFQDGYTSADILGRTCWKPCIATACFCGSSRLPRSETGSITGVLEAEVPAEELDIFNRHIIGYIQVESEFSA